MWTHNGRERQTKDFSSFRNNGRRSFESWRDIDRDQLYLQPSWNKKTESKSTYLSYDSSYQIKKKYYGMEERRSPSQNLNKGGNDIEEKSRRSSDAIQSPVKSRALPVVEKAPDYQANSLKGADLQQKLKDFKSGKNLNSLRSLLKGLPAKSASVPDGRSSVDSAFYDHSREGSFAEENRPQVIQKEKKPGNEPISRKNSLSPIGSINSTLPPTSRRWGVAVDNIRERRQRTTENTKKRLVELDQLKKNVEESQARANRLEAEIEPCKEKVKRYEEIIENLEERLEQHKKVSVTKEREKLLEIDKLERKHKTEVDKEIQSKEELEIHYKDIIRRSQSEVKQLKKQAEELAEELETEKEWSKAGEDNNPKEKQLSSMRKELMEVRKLLEDSETERLNERKGKLSTIQNMIKLTKQKADVEEELDEKKKEDTKENSNKYMKLTAKLAVTEMKLQKLRQEKGQEIEEMQRKYLDEIRELKKSQEKEINTIKKERDTLEKQLNEENDQSRPASSSNLPTDVLPIDWKNIMRYMEEKGFKQGTHSVDKVAGELYREVQNQVEKNKELESLIAQANNGNLKSVIEELREEKRTTKRRLEDLKETLANKDSQMKVTEMALKRQIEDLLGEKKGAYLQMQQAIDNADTAKEDADKYKEELDNVKALLQKKQTEMNMLQDNLLSVTNEMKTVDADLGKTKKELSVKEAELARVKRDIDIEMGLVTHEKGESNRIRTDLDQKRLAIKECEKTIYELENKIQVLTETVESYRLQTERLNIEREEFVEELQGAKNEIVEYIAKTQESEEVIRGLKTQIKSVESALKEKVDRFATVAMEFEKTRTEVLATQHLLSEEQEKNQTLEDEIDAIADELKQKTEESERLNEKVNDLKDELENIKLELTHTQENFADTEDSLKSQSSTKSLIEKQLRLLQGQYKDATREKQSLQTSLEDMKQQVHSINASKKQLQEDLQGLKWKLNEKTLALNEMKADQETTGQTLLKYENELHGAEDNLVALKQEKQKSTEENERLKIQVSDLKRTNSQLSEQLRKRKEDIDKQGKYSCQRMDELLHENDELRNQIRNAQSILQEFPDLDTLEYDETDSGISTNCSLATPVGALAAKLKSSERNLREKEVEFAKLKGQNESLNAELSKTSNQFAKEKVNTRQEYERKIKEAKEEIEQLKHDSEKITFNLEQRLRDIQLKNKEMESLNANLQYEKQEQDKKIKVLEGDISRYKKSEKLIQSQMEGLDKKLIHVKETESQKFTHAKEETKALMDKVARLENNYQNLQMEIEKKNELITDTVNEKDKILNEMKQSIGVLREEKTKLEKQVKEKEKEVRAEVEKLAVAETGYQTLQIEIEKKNELIKDTINEKDKIMNEMKQSTGVLREEKTKLEKQVKEKEKEVRAEVEKQNEIQDEYHNVAKEMAKNKLKYGSEIADLQRNLCEKEASFAAAKRELELKVITFDELENKLSLVEKKLQGNVNQKMQMEKELVAQRQKALDEAMQLRDKIVLVEQQKQDLQENILKLQHRIEMAPVQTSIPMTNNEVLDLKKKLEDNNTELAGEKKEKREALKCVRVLVRDNETLTNCISELQNTISQQKEELNEATGHLKDVLHKYQHIKEAAQILENQKETWLINQRILEAMAQDTARKEQDRSARLYNENEALRKDLNEARTEKEKLVWQVEDKTKELEKTRGELEYIQKVAKYNMQYRRNDGFLESQVAFLTNDRNMLSKQMQMLELTNCMLQDKLKEAKTWYGNLGSSGVEPRTSSPVSLKGLRDSQVKHDQFLQSQFELLASKMVNDPSLRISP